MWTISRFKAHQRVIVRSKEEILATLDANGCLNNQPFMPEMLQYCGREFRVAAVAHKTCDTVNKTGGRQLDNTLHLEGTRCDGSAHGGCEAECNIFWNDAWVKPVDDNGRAGQRPTAPGCSEETLRASVFAPDSGRDGVIRYRCQATQLPYATRLLPWWNLRQYWLDMSTGNFSFGYVLKVLSMATARQLLRLPLGHRLWLSVSDVVHRMFTGKPTPRISGTLPLGTATPVETLNVQPGEWVRVRPAAEIARTLSVNNKNRGMWFDAEQLEYCERSFQVRRRVRQIVNEHTGEMLPMQNPCITLEGSLCSGAFSEHRLLCPRAITGYWREAWLARDDASRSTGREELPGGLKPGSSA
jgi:hypothetical protein